MEQAGGGALVPLLSTLSSISTRREMHPLMELSHPARAVRTNKLVPFMLASCPIPL
jgi:hypothetical protein